MGMLIERGAKRTAKPDIFISHSSRDKAAALHLASTLISALSMAWLDDWELEVGQSLANGIAKAMDESRFIAILIAENYGKNLWTKTEYKKALAHEQKEQRTVRKRNSFFRQRERMLSAGIGREQRRSDDQSAGSG